MKQEKIFRVYFFSILDLNKRDEIYMKEFRNGKFSTLEKAHEFGKNDYHILPILINCQFKKIAIVWTA